MPLSLPTPLVIPAVPERQADKIWIVSMQVNAADPLKKVTANFAVAPYVSTTGELFKEKIQNIPVDDVLAACATNPTLGAALMGIYNAVEELCKQRGMFGMEPDPIAPSIGVQPQSVSVYEGDQAAFSVMAAGRPLNYQWRKNGVNIDGATGASLNFVAVIEDDQADYDVVISNSAGSVTSDVVVLTVDPVPVVAPPPDDGG
jgi:hypothetical protein